MPKYKITDKTTGQSLVVSGDAPPSEQTISEIFSQRGGNAQQAQKTAQPQTLMQKRFPEMIQAGKTLRGGENMIADPNSSTLAGGARVARSVVESASAPLGMIDRAIRGRLESPTTSPIERTLVGGGLDAMNAIGQGANYVGKKINQATLGLAGGVLGHNLGTTPQKASQIYREVPELMGTLSSVVLPAYAGKVAGKSVPAVKNMVNENRISKGMQELKEVAPPTNKELGYDQHLKVASRYIAEQERLTPINPKAELSPIRQAVDNVKMAKQRLWDEKISPVIEKNYAVTIDGANIGKAIKDNVSSYTLRHEPRLAKMVEDYADSFNGKLSIKDLNDAVAELNAKTNAYQKALPEVKAMMENADPIISAKIRAVEAMRDELYGKLDELGNPEVRQLKKDYGSLKQIQTAIERKVVPAERGTKTGSFYETPFGAGVKTVATVGTAMNNLPLAAAGGSMALLKRYLIDRNKPNPKITRSFERLGKSNLMP